MSSLSIPFWVPSSSGGRLLSLDLERDSLETLPEFELAYLMVYLNDVERGVRDALSIKDEPSVLALRHALLAECHRHHEDLAVASGRYYQSLCAARVMLRDDIESWGAKRGIRSVAEAAELIEALVAERMHTSLPWPDAPSPLVLRAGTDDWRTFATSARTHYQDEAGAILTSVVAGMTKLQSLQHFPSCVHLSTTLCRVEVSAEKSTEWPRFWTAVEVGIRCPIFADRRVLGLAEKPTTLGIPVPRNVSEEP